MRETTLGDLLDIPAAQLVVIHDHWSGYSPHAPITASYELRPGRRGGLAGKGRLSSNIVGERLVDVTLPADTAARFLATLASAAMTAGPYTPRFEWTDDYPRIELALHVGADATRRRAGIALLFSESQGAMHAPWGACLAGELWTLPGEEIGRALAELHGPLKRATLERMMRKADSARAVRARAGSEEPDT